MPQRFRTRGCLIAVLLLGLLSCGGLFMLVRPQSAPDAVAELKALPLYPNATAVDFRHPLVDNSSAGGTGVLMGGPQGQSGSGPVIVRDYGEMSFEVQAEPGMVLDFYTGEFSTRGWRCNPPGGTSVSAVAECRITDEGPVWPRFTGFDGPGASPPWIKLDRVVSFRFVALSAHRSSPGAPTTNVSITYDYLSVR
ncbi:MAG TPA: hypothetical protein VF914_17375 [Chloroflexia bacterium]|jgi:hypothetical protein